MNTNKNVVKKFEDKEEAVYSCPIVLGRGWIFKKKRHFVITNKQIYIFKSSSIKRKIKQNKVTAVTLSKTNKTEIVIHIDDQPDIHFNDKLMDEIIEVLQFIHFVQYTKNLKIYRCPGGLNQYCTSDQDVLYGINLLPLEKCRDEAYEIYEEPLQYNQDGTVNANDLMQDNFERLAIIDKDDKECARVAGQTTKSLNFTIYGPVKDQKEVLLQDFNIKKVVGEGAFGKVYLVEKKDTKALYAMKTLAKDMLLEDDRILESTLLEKKILQQAHHPFLIGTEYAFQSDSTIYFVMAFVKGGELYTHLRDQKAFNEELVKFYIVQVASGLGYLHSKKIVYRDLKTKNILMGEDGYVFLADFGLAKFVKNDKKTESMCGTPYMMAPEIINNQAYSFEVDWWALGTLAFQLLTGYYPFYNGGNLKKCFETILKGPIQYPDPKHISLSKNCKLFLEACLNKKSQNRLGTKNGVEEILSHPWLKTMNEQDIINKKIKPSYVPTFEDDKSDPTAAPLSKVSLFSVQTIGTKKKIQQHAHKFKGF